MGIEVTARHMKEAEEILAYARERAGTLESQFERIEHIHVILDIEKHRQFAEIFVQAKNHVRMDARETSDNMRASIDGAVDKMERQLRKLRDRVHDHKAAMKHVNNTRDREASA